MNCQNCEHPFESNDLFCSQCSSPKKVNRLTVKSVFQEFSERYFSFDNKFLSTSLTLLKSPELVINGYVNGLRIRYVNPITYLIIAATLSSVQIFLIKNGYLNFDLEFVPKNQEKIPFDMKSYFDWIFDHQSLLMFISIPFLAIISKIVFLKREEFNFAEHNLIYFYTYSFCSIFTLVFVLPFILIFKGPFSYYAYASYFILFWYHIFALKRIFNLSIKQIFLKSLLFIVVLVLVYLAVSIFLGIIFFIYLLSTNGLKPA